MQCFLLLPPCPADRNPGCAGVDRGLLDDAEVTSDRLRAQAGVNRLEAVGVSEAPRGTLFHHYQVDENGLLTRVNLIIATGQNNLAMNRTVAQIAKALHPRSADTRRDRAQPGRGGNPRL